MESQLVAAANWLVSKTNSLPVCPTSSGPRSPASTAFQNCCGRRVEDTTQANELITIITTESSELMRMVEDILTGARSILGLDLRHNGIGDRS